MVYLNLQINSIIEGLNTAGYIPASLVAGGATTATVEAAATQPVGPSITGDLWFNTSTAVLKIYSGTSWQDVALTPDEKSALASLATSVAQAEAAELGAEDARDTILGMVTATGDAGTEVIWNNVTGVLTVPKGDAGDGGGATVVSDLTDVNVVAPLNGQILSYDDVSGTFINAT